jgi:hypothetical protein
MCHGDYPMTHYTGRAKGGAAASMVRLEKSVKEYLANPIICKGCLSPIPLNGKRPCDVKRNVFCNHSCAQTYNNRLLGRRTSKKGKNGRKCPFCGGDISKWSRMCSDCKSGRLMAKVKADLKTRPYQSYRSLIQKNARAVYRNSGLPMKCVVCGYDKHIDVSHKKSVSSFADDATVEQINSIGNLMALCPNHHWEYDNGLLSI